MSEGFTFLVGKGQLKSALDLANKYLELFVAASEENGQDSVDMWSDLDRQQALSIVGAMPLGHQTTISWASKLETIIEKALGKKDAAFLDALGCLYEKGISIFHSHSLVILNLPTHRWGYLYGS